MGLFCIENKCTISFLLILSVWTSIVKELQDCIFRSIRHTLLPLKCELKMRVRLIVKVHIFSFVSSLWYFSAYSMMMSRWRHTDPTLLIWNRRCEIIRTVFKQSCAVTHCDPFVKSQWKLKNFKDFPSVYLRTRHDLFLRQDLD